MRPRPILLVLSALCVASLIRPVSAAESPRLLVLTDIGGDPDDQQSLVRLLVHANEFEIEGFIASASGTRGELKEAVTRPDLIREMIAAYARVLPNLKIHARGYPEADTLLAVVKSGNPHRERAFIGEGHDTEGSNWIIKAGSKVDPRPLDIAIWGGQTDFAQALWRVRQDRGAGGLREFVSRLRVYDINDQDGIVEWMWHEVPGLFYILAKAPDGQDKRLGAYRGMYLGGDLDLTSSDWIERHVRQGHGPLGALYPPKTYTRPNPHGVLKEGDSPSWLFFLNNGLNVPEHPEWGGWGGRFTNLIDRIYRDASDTWQGESGARATVCRWRGEFQNEFAARMNWCVADTFTGANHPPQAVLNTDASLDPIAISAHPGDSVALSAAGSTDPDGDSLRVSWFIYPEAGINSDGATLSSETGETVELRLPRNQPAGTVHIILTVTDSGTPPLTRHRRAVVTVR